MNLQFCVGITGANQNVWPILILSMHIVPCKQVVLNKCLLMQTPDETVDVKMRCETVGKTLLFGWGGGHVNRWWHTVHITKSVVINKNDRQMDLTGITQVTIGSAKHF